MQCRDLYLSSAKTRYMVQRLHCIGIGMCPMFYEDMAMRNLSSQPFQDAGFNQQWTNENADYLTMPAFFLSRDLIRKTSKHGTNGRFLLTGKVMPPLYLPVSRIQKDAVLEDGKRDVLMILYRECGGSEWEKSDGWGSDKPLEAWYGIKVMNGRVVELNLKGNNLHGEYGRDRLPSTSLLLTGENTYV